MSEGLTGKDANGNTSTTDGPYKQNFAYSAFSETVSTTGKSWGAPVPNYTKTFSPSTGRDSLTGYDAAGNVISDRIRTYPLPILDRTMKYDAAGRQVETFDPAVRTCCENNNTTTVSYDGNGWKTKQVSVSVSGTATGYEFRSTVLGGETVGTMSTSSGSSVVSKSFTVPVVGGELKYSEPVGQNAVVNFTRTSPEGLYEHNADLPEKAFDPRGANAGIDDPQDGDTSGYPMNADAAVFSRCAEGGEPVSCSVEERFDKAYNRLWEVPPHKQTTKKKQDPPKSDAGHRIAMRSLFMASKSEPDPETPGTIDPESIPDDDGDDDPDVDLENQIVTIRISLFPEFVGASEGMNDPPTDDLKNRNPCARMAKRAQKVANEAIAWGVKNKQSWAERLKMFDMSFTPYYIGQRWLGSNIKYFIDTDGGVPTSKRMPREYGQEDFKEEFLDAEATRYMPALNDKGEILNAFNPDQVHHFVGLFSAGINSASITSTAQDLRDLIQRNPGDRALGDAAYQIGSDLAENPVKNLERIGQTIKSTICR